MRIPQVAAAILLSVSCALPTSCVAGPTDEAAAYSTGSPPTDDAEPTGEAAQPAYESVFHFTETVKDDGEGEGGGWQEAIARLKFADWRRPFAPVFWQCPIKVGMPLRNKWIGRISASSAATITARAATDATESVMHSRQSWARQEPAYCREFYAEMRKILNPVTHPLGARVEAP